MEQALLSSPRKAKRFLIHHKKLKLFLNLKAEDMIEGVLFATYQGFTVQ